MSHDSQANIETRSAALTSTKKALLELRLRRKSASQAKAILRHPDRVSAPLSFGQERLWFLAQMDPESILYHVPRAVRLYGELDHVALQGAVNALIDRHESLRTVYEAVDGVPVQRITPSRPVPMALVDVEGITAADRETAATRMMLEKVREPFDLATDLMLRATLFRFSQHEHIFLLITHHIVSDAWSEGVLFRDLAALYDACRNGRLCSLPVLPIQYADFAEWQRECVKGPVLEELLDYWKRTLDGAPASPALCTDRMRPAIPTFRGAEQTFHLSPSLTQAIGELARNERATLFMTLLGAFQTLLWRYTGETDVCVGTAIANRQRPELEPLIGFFVNTLVLRTHLAGDITFRELLMRVRETALGAYTHQDLPFEQLVETLQPQRDQSRHPLVQIMFDLRHNQRIDWTSPGLEAIPVKLDLGLAKYDLHLSMGMAAEGLQGSLSHNRDLFDDATIRRMLGHWKTLLQAVVNDPDLHLSRLPLMSDVEKHQVVAMGQGPCITFAQERPIHELFEAQVRTTPDAVAVAWREQQISYGELNRKANRLGRRLRELGVASQVLVAVCLEPTPDMVAALWAILKCGGAFVPLDPAYPKERLAFMIKDAGVPVLLTQQHLLPRLATNGEQVICVDQETELGHDESDLGVAVRLDQLAYVIYTSGSTGLPKGVMIPHRGLHNYLSWCIEAYGAAQGKGSIVHSSISVDLTITSLFAPLLVGGTIIIADPAPGVESLIHEIRKVDDLSFLKLTPAHMKLLGQQMNPWGLPGRARALVIGGEALLAEDVAVWQEAAPETVLFNEYGPTETVVGCCVFQVPPGRWKGGPIPIGRPIANTELFILDAERQPMPIGVPGELYIGGAGLARGYLNRPELTAEKFVPHPFRSGARLYRTGDRARLLVDGNIEFLGRLDEQVKIRGFRIEPGEIEAVLSQHPAVRGTAIVPWDDPSGNKQLVAYVVPARDQTLGAEGLQSFLRDKLPPHMVPSVYIMLDHLPLSPSGKVDRRALPIPENREQRGVKTFVPARSAVEEILADIWSQVLGVDRVGIHDDFFSLGGHSLLAVQVIARLHSKLKVGVPIRWLFDRPTVAALAEVIEETLVSQTESQNVSMLLDELERQSDTSSYP
jgi:amino acid adenylation domain-containing protein